MSIAIVTSFEVKKTLLGSYQVLFECPHCESQLHCKETELNTDDWCPECRQTFRISPKANAQIEAQRQQALNKKQRKVAKKHEHAEKNGEPVGDQGSRAEVGGESPEAVDGSQRTAAEPPPKVALTQPPADSGQSSTVCPSCAEVNASGAVKCVYCGDTIGRQRTSRATTNGNVQPPNAKDNNSGFRIFGYALASGVVLMGLAAIALPLLIGACCLGILNVSRELPIRQTGIDVDSTLLPQEAGEESQSDMDDPATQVLQQPSLPETLERRTDPGTLSDQRMRPPNILPPHVGRDPQSPVDSIDFGVVLEITVEQLAERRVRIHGNTNLPPDTNLVVTIKDQGQRDAYGQSQCSVLRDGGFHSEAISPQEGLRDGIYVAEVKMPSPRGQPENVQRVIGLHGERLHGPRVQHGPIGVMVFAAKEFMIGRRLAVEARRVRSDDHVREYQDWLTKIQSLNERLLQARSNDWLSDGADKQNMARWAGFAGGFSRDVHLYEAQLTWMKPLPIRNLVAAALNDLKAMFHATAFRKSDEFTEASTRFAKSIEDLQQLVEREKLTQ